MLESWEMKADISKLGNLFLGKHVVHFSNSCSRTNSKQEKIRIPCLPSFMYVLPFYLKLLAGAEQARVFSIVILAFRAGVLQKELL